MSGRATTGSDVERAPRERSGEVVLVKLGGSLITEKTEVESPRREVMVRLAGELAEVLPELRARQATVLLGHGSGSYGHVAAERHGYLALAPGERRQTGAGAIHNRAEALHGILVATLVDAGVECLSLAPSSFLVARDGVPVECFVRPLEVAVDSGWVPVVYGDVVVDESAGYSICSTETVLAALLEPLRQSGHSVHTAIWLGATDGILDARGETIDRIDSRDPSAVREALGDAAGTDVTGGIRHRFETVRRLAGLGVRSLLVNGLRPGAFAAALRGEALSGSVVESTDPGAEP